MGKTAWQYSLVELLVATTAVGVSLSIIYIVFQPKPEIAVAVFGAAISTILIAMFAQAWLISGWSYWLRLVFSLFLGLIVASVICIATTSTDDDSDYFALGALFRIHTELKEYLRANVAEPHSLSEVVTEVTMVPISATGRYDKAHPADGYVYQLSRTTSGDLVLIAIPKPLLKKRKAYLCTMTGQFYRRVADQAMLGEAEAMCINLRGWTIYEDSRVPSPANLTRDQSPAPPSDTE